MGSLPLLPPEKVIGRRDVLVVAPHPDDESLGCGGLLAWAAASGNRPRVLFITNGEQSHPGSVLYPPAKLARLRQGEALEACAALGLANDAVTFLSAPDSGLLALDAAQKRGLTRAIAQWVSLSGRAALCIPASSDPHGDHIATHWLVRGATRPPEVELYAYPVWTWLLPVERGTAFPQGRRVDIGSYLEKKSRAIAAHASQHGTVVPDAREPFVLPAALLHFSRLPFEVLLDVDL